MGYTMFIIATIATFLFLGVVVLNLKDECLFDEFGPKANEESIKEESTKDEIE